MGDCSKELMVLLFYDETKSGELGLSRRVLYT